MRNCVLMVYDTRSPDPNVVAIVRVESYPAIVKHDGVLFLPFPGQDAPAALSRDYFNSQSHDFCDTAALPSDRLQRVPAIMNVEESA